MHRTNDIQWHASLRENNLDAPEHSVLTVLHWEAAFLFDPRPLFAEGLLSSSSTFTCSSTV